MRIYVTQQRKCWNYEPPPGWAMTHYDRFDFIECAIYYKPADKINQDDFLEIGERGSRPREWVEPGLVETE